MFNIGGRGQMLIAGAAAGWVGFPFELPWPIHVIVAILVGIVGGALWGGIVGLLKARTGAHEVIVTIMLNYVAFYLVFYAAHRQSLLQAPGSNNPKSPPMKDTAVLPKLFGDRSTTCTSASSWRDRRRRRLVDPQPLEPRLPVPRRRREPERGPRRGHQRQDASTSSRCSSPVGSSVSPASTRCSAP